eukprot:Opistho-2@44370
MHIRPQSHPPSTSRVLALTIAAVYGVYYAAPSVGRTRGRASDGDEQSAIDPVALCQSRARAMVFRRTHVSTPLTTAFSECEQYGTLTSLVRLHGDATFDNVALSGVVTSWSVRLYSGLGLRLALQ